MCRDRVVIWVLEYVLGGILVVVPLGALALLRRARTDARLWAAALFVVCLGVILVSCASSMRQRMRLASRIDRLAEALGSDADRRSGRGT
jgi:hypothetical protein